MSETKIIYGLYGDDDLLLDGVNKCKQEGIDIKEVYTPFPVHGLDKALGLKKSRLGEATFIYGILSVALICWMTWYMMNKDWPQNIGGKPSFSFMQNLPAFVPIIFEFFVLITAHLLVITYFFRNKQYPGQKAMNPDPRTTDDKFLVEFHNQDLDKVKEILQSTGVEEITMKTIEAKDNEDK